MSDNLHELMTSPEARRAYQLDYSIELISEIATQYDQTIDRGDLLAARCMLDSFYVHIRLLADFLVKRTPAKKDFGPADFGVEWTVPTTGEADRLAQYWQTASTYVVHFGRPRVPNNVRDLAAFEVGEKSFRAMAVDALIVYAEFLKGLLRVTPSWSGGARIPDRGTDPEEWSDRNLSDGTDLLRASYIEACGKVWLDGELLLTQIE